MFAFLQRQRSRRLPRESPGNGPDFRHWEAPPSAQAAAARSEGPPRDAAQESSAGSPKGAHLQYLLPPFSRRHHYGDGGLVRSLHSKVSTHVSFVNNLDVPVAILWLNYRGDEVLYATLRPGARYRQQTYVTHPWTFRCTRGGNPNDVVVGHRRVLFPTRQESVVAMERPAAAGAAGMRWSIDRHWYFKWWPGFASGVRALLMCHKRLERQRRAEGAAAGRGCAAAPTLGDLPLEVVLLVVRWMAPADMAVVLPPQEGVLGVKIDARDLGAHLDAAAADPKGEEDPTVAAPGGARGTG